MGKQPDLKGTLSKLRAKKLKEDAAEDMYEALRTTIIHPQSVVVDTLSQCRAELKRVCDRIDNFKDIANIALAKANGK
ncbi:hypothetical protein ES703_97681 [subsurface metagenome]